MQEDEAQNSGRRRDYSVGLALSFGFAATVFWLGPTYTQVEGLGRWIFYTIALILTLIASIGLLLEVSEYYSESERARLRVFTGIGLLIAWMCHLSTLVFFEEGFMFILFRVIAMSYVSLLGFLITLVILDIADNAPKPRSKTEAVLTVLSFLSVLLAIVGSLLGLG